MKKLILISLTTLNLFFLTPAFANDTAGTTAAGGINFTHMTDVSMEREQLTISPNKVKVIYLFKNNRQDYYISFPIRL
jgi:hypothetical protein